MSIENPTTDHRRAADGTAVDSPTTAVPRQTTPGSRSTPSVMDQMGGPMGFVYPAVPVAVFVAVNGMASLTWAIVVSLGVGLAITGVRLLRRERFTTAASGMLGIAVAAGIAAATGSSRDFFAVGIWGALVLFVAVAASVAARRPVTGVVWNLMHGGTHAWRADRPVRRAHDLASSAVALVFGARFVVQQWLYLADDTVGLGLARILMGIPLTVVAAVVVVWAFRRSTARLLPARR